MAKKILVATTNHNKVGRIKNLLSEFSVEIVSLDDLHVTAPEPDETGLNCVSIAAQKALAYLDYVDEDTIVLAQDDTIKFDGVDETDNPGTAIKEPVKVQYGSFTDSNAIKFYTDLAKKYGGSVPMTFLYGHAVAYKENDDRNLIQVQAGESSLHAKLVDTAHKQESVPGYFLAAIMKINIGGAWKYYTDLSETETIKSDSDLKDSILALLEPTGILDNPTKG